MVSSPSNDSPVIYGSATTKCPVSPRRYSLAHRYSRDAALPGMLVSQGTAQSSRVPSPYAHAPLSRKTLGGFRLRPCLQGSGAAWVPVCYLRASARESNPKRGQQWRTIEKECCVCFNEFGSGLRTIVYPFECTGTVQHPICRGCDRNLFTRNDDKCPTCRADRSAESIAAGGWRPPPAPREEPAPAGFGGMMFFPVDNDGEPDLFIGTGPMVGPAADMALALSTGFQAAVRNRNSRANVSHPALAPDTTADEPVRSSNSNTSGDAARRCAVRPQHRRRVRRPDQPR